MTYEKARHNWRAGAKTILQRSCDLMQHSHALTGKMNARSQMTFLKMQITQKAVVPL